MRAAGLKDTSMPRATEKPATNQARRLPWAGLCLPWLLVVVLPVVGAPPEAPAAPGPYGWA
jgi:hypothetical protein